MEAFEMTYNSKIKSLREDLQGAWNFAKEDEANALKQAGIVCSEWTLSIDTENLAFLKAIYKTADGSYSMNSLAHTIRKGNKIKGLD
jgi:hypothetical protein